MYYTLDIPLPNSGLLYIIHNIPQPRETFTKCYYLNQIGGFGLDNFVLFNALRTRKLRIRPIVQDNSQTHDQKPSHREYGYHNIMAKFLFLDALLTQALLILCLQLSIDLGALRGGISMKLGL